jgi:Flp pilus assembly protein TadD
MTLPASTGAGAETAIETGPKGGSLVSQAHNALRAGNAQKAVSLARQAVAANPADADAWLTYGAALQASGNGGAAHQAYKDCIDKARTANVSECRVLAR